MCIRDSSDTVNDLYMKKPGDDSTVLVAEVTPHRVVTVSYTHLDVYKRQSVAHPTEKIAFFLPQVFMHPAIFPAI